MKRPLLLGLIGAGLILLALPLAYLFSHIEPYEEQIDHGPAPEAQRNPYLAAEHFLRQQEIPVSSERQLRLLPKQTALGQTLLLLGPRKELTPAQTQELLNWAEHGGHLIVAAEGFWDEDEQSSKDLLLNALDIRLLHSKELPEEEPEDAEANLYPHLTQLYLENESAPAYFNFDPDRHLEDHGNRAYAWANSAKATHLLQLEHGQGLITVLSDAGLWRNDGIDLYDHAWLLWYLSQDSHVQLVYNHRLNLSLWSLICEHFAQALILLSLTLGAGLWHVGLRQGPLLARPPMMRRKLQEHIRASANFALRQIGPRYLLNTLQLDIQRRARHRHPGFERLPVAQQWQSLAQLSQLPISVISSAMRPVISERLDAHDFTRQVANLQTLRNAL